MSSQQMLNLRPANNSETFIRAKVRLEAAYSILLGFCLALIYVRCLISSALAVSHLP